MESGGVLQSSLMKQIDGRVLRWLTLALTIVVVSCSSNPKPDSLPPQSIASPKLPDAPDQATQGAVPVGSPEAEVLGELPPELTPLEADAPEEAVPSQMPSQMPSQEPLPAGSSASGSMTVVDPKKVHARDDPTLVVIEEYEDPDDQEEIRLRLMRASLQERERRRTAPEASVVITDKNLAEFAEGGNLTYVEGAAAEPPDAPLRGPGSASAAEEEFWRTGARDLRLEWRESVDRLKELEADAAGLRRRFYAEDDPFVRDGEVKPAWDRALDLIEEEKRNIDRVQEDLAEFLNEGRRAGALPGWLREGIELEPVVEKDGKLPEVDPREPKVIDN